MQTSDGWHGTTSLTVRKGGVVAIGGDGQVSVGQTIVKANAKKVRRLGKIAIRSNRSVQPVEACSALLNESGDVP